MLWRRLFAPITGAIILLGGAPAARAAGEATIENFEEYSSGIGSWTAQSEDIDLGLNLITLGAIEGNRSLGVTIDPAALGGQYIISNANLDQPVPKGIENFEFQYRVLLGLNVGKSFTVTLTDQDNNTYVSPTVAINSIELLETTTFTLPLSGFTPPATNGAIVRLKGVSLGFSTGVLSVAAHEQLDSFRFTWTPATNSVHTMSTEFGTRVNGPNSNFTMNLTLDPADVDVSKFRVRVGYDDTQVSFTGVINNTGQPASDVDYSVGTPQLLTGVDHVNTYQTVTLDALPALITPAILGQLNFTAKPTFSDPNNRVWIVLMPEPPLDTLSDENWDLVPVVFGSQDTPVPVHMSAFSLE